MSMKAKAAELRTKTKSELVAQVVALRDTQFQLRMRMGSAEATPKTHVFKQSRRDVARIKTVLNELGRSNHE